MAKNKRPTVAASAAAVATTIDKTILDNFYKLVHTQPHVRNTAAVSTFKILKGIQKANNSEAFNRHLNYCVERLVAGLASSRAFARRGYGTLLLALLNKYQVSCERLFMLAQQKYGQISNETTKDNLLGYFLLIRIVLQSGNYKTTKQNEAYVEKMYKYLLQLKDQKSYFDYPVSKLLADEYKTFYPHMISDIPPSAFGSDAKLSHTDLLILALCNKQEPISQLQTLDLSSILKLSQALISDRLQKRPLHPVWIEFSNMVMMTFPQQFDEYCSTVLHKHFFKPNHNELAALGLELIEKLLETVNYGNAVKCLLSDYVVRLLIVSLRTKNSLHKHCVEFFSSLTRYFKENPGNLPPPFVTMIQGAIIARFCRPPGSITFDEDSKSQSICNLLNEAKYNIVMAHLVHLIEQFDKKFSQDESTRIYLNCAKQMAHIVRRPQMKECFGHVQMAAKFLIVNSLFSFVDPLAMKKSFWKKNRIMPAIQPLDMPVKVALKGAYHAAMDYIVSCSATKERIQVLMELIEFIDELVQSGGVGFYSETGDLTLQYTSYIKCLSEHKLAIEMHNNPKILYPVTSLYLLYGFQIIEHGLKCDEQLEELQQVTTDALKNDPSDGSWADILVDQILAILSATECHAWIRKLCVSVFGSLLPHISETSIDLICDAIKAPLSGAGDDDDDECSDMDDAEMSDQKENQSGEEECDEQIEFTDGSDSGEDDSDSVCEMEAVDEFECDSNMVGTSEHSNGTPGAKDKDDAEDQECNESDDEEEEYLDDEQMMKMDTVLADMFRLRRVGKSKKRDPSFKLRCLDLIKKIITKKHNDTVVINKILATIVPLAAKSNKSAETRPIADKINTMIKKMRGKSKANFTL